MATGAACSQVAAAVVVALFLLLGAAAVCSGSRSTQQCHDEDQAALVAGRERRAGQPLPLRVLDPRRHVVLRLVRRGLRQHHRPRGGPLRVAGRQPHRRRAIPDAVADLKHLRTLVLHHLPGLTGGIPESLASLANLSLLTISYTGMSGPVPSFLSRLTSLATLDLSYNAFTGAIPASLADLPDLTGVNLSRNRLSGPIPPLLFSKLSSSDQHDDAYLWLSRNNLSGSVPAEFAAVRFAHVDLSRNALTGDPSAALFGAGKPVQHLDLSRNGFRFSLTGAELPEQLNFLDLSHNGIREHVPEQVARIASLQQLNLSYNKLCGQVPSGGIMSRFDAYSFQHNSCLCGAPLPACPKIS